MKKVIISVLILVIIFGLFLIGCQKEFNDIVNGDVYKISMRHGGSGLLYSTTNEKEVNHFIEAMSKTDYIRIPNLYLTVGGSTMRIYDKGGK